MKVAILSSFFQKYHATANGLCARNLYDCLIQQNHNVKVFCYYSEVKDNDNNVIIVQRNDNENNERPLLWKRLHSYYTVFRSFIDPYYDAKLVQSYLKELERSKFLPEYIIAMYFPYESIIAAYKYKAKHPEVKIVAFELDSAGDGISNQNIFNKFTSTAIESKIDSFYKRFDRVIIMRSHLKYWESTHFRYISEMRVSDIPILTTKKKVSETTPIEHDIYMGIYSGLLDSTYRNPSYLLDVMSLVNRDNVILNIHFYSKGNCETLIAKRAEKEDYIYQHGYIDKDSLNLELGKADFLFSIGNSNSNSLPSKLIDYISSGKPIIHLALQDDDVCVNYLNKYKNCIIINIKDDVVESSYRLKEFIQKSSDIAIDDNYIFSTFVENTPQYSVKLIFE